MSAALVTYECMNSCLLNNSQHPLSKPAHNICTMLINEVSFTEKRYHNILSTTILCHFLRLLMLLPFVEGHSSTILKRIYLPSLLFNILWYATKYTSTLSSSLAVRSCHMLIHPFILIKQNILGNYCQHESFLNLNNILLYCKDWNLIEYNTPIIWIYIFLWLYGLNPSYFLAYCSMSS